MTVRLPCSYSCLAAPIQAMQHPNRALAVFARIVNGHLEVYETMRGSKRLTLRALLDKE